MHQIFSKYGLYYRVKKTFIMRATKWRLTGESYLVIVESVFNFLSVHVNRVIVVFRIHDEASPFPPTWWDVRSVILVQVFPEVSCNEDWEIKQVVRNWKWVRVPCGKCTRTRILTHTRVWKTLFLHTRHEIVNSIDTERSVKL